jgi:hypothetical protein
VHEACDRVLGGRAGLNHGFAPSAPELAKICHDIITPYRTERVKVEKILTAEVLPPINEDLRQKGYEVLKACADEMRKLPPEHPPGVDWKPPPADPVKAAEEHLESLKANPLPPLSETALRAAGLIEKEEM